MSDAEKMHAWSHLVLFLMLFMLALAVMRFGSPTGLAASNQTITAQSVTDLKPFLTAVGLLMAVIIATGIALSVSFHDKKEKVLQPGGKAATELSSINRELARIRKRLGR